AGEGGAGHRDDEQRGPEPWPADRRGLGAHGRSACTARPRRGRFRGRAVSTAQAPVRSAHDPRPLIAIHPATGRAMSSVVVAAWSITPNLPASATPKMTMAQPSALRYLVMVKLPCLYVKGTRHAARR